MVNRRSPRIVEALAATALLFGIACPASAQDYDENSSGRALFVQGDIRLTGADGENSWLDGGFGKARFGSDDGDFSVRPRAVEGDVVWKPQLSWSLDATIAAVAQDGQEHAVDLSEAYLSFRRDPIGRVKLAGRLGLFWSPVSLEHSGPAWTVTETITPSAINSWVGEELKVAALEETSSVGFGSGRLSATLALFGLNDTAGTLLTFRGWTLHDEKATAFGRQPLPPLNAFMQDAQAARTRPVIEIDNRPGFYGKVGWASPALKLQAFYYDNRSDPEAVDSQLQWGWRTRFGNLGAQWKPSQRVTITSQALTGTTRMGFPIDGKRWVDTRFRSAFLLVTRQLGNVASISGRAEAFGTTGRGSVEGSESSEHGWAATLAGRHSFGRHLDLLGELLHIASSRGERLRAAPNSHQAQAIAQLSARLTL